MKKVVSATEMARIEQLAYAAGASEEAFMEQAGRAVAQTARRMVEQQGTPIKIALLLGTGNNAGDGYVAGRILLEEGMEVHAFRIADAEHVGSPLCRLQSQRFEALGGRVTLLHEEMLFECLWKGFSLLIDGLFGTGFHGKVKGLLKSLIEAANRSRLALLAIDIPSGINGTTGEIGDSAIQATRTLCLGMPKTGCFLGEAWNYVGILETADFGLTSEYTEQAEPDYWLIDSSWAATSLPPLHRTRHKYQAGYLIGLGGSSGMTGAPLLASRAALRSGAGIVRLLHPVGLESELAASALLEVIREAYPLGHTGSLAVIQAAMQRASALFLGPGLGRSSETAFLLKAVLETITKPCVLDADALFLLAETQTPLPENAILTPHQGEMAHLLGKTGKKGPLQGPAMQEWLMLCQDYVEKKKVTLVLKGAPTFICHPGQRPHLSIRGHPGMATAGSGDVLTGVIAALLAQGCSPWDAARLGTYLHGLAGEAAAQAQTGYSLIATDIIDYLPVAFATIMSSGTGPLNLLDERDKLLH